MITIKRPYHQAEMIHYSLLLCIQLDALCMCTLYVPGLFTNPIELSASDIWEWKSHFRQGAQWSRNGISVQIFHY